MDALRLAQLQRRQNETPDERQARLEAVRLAQQERRQISNATQLFQQNAVKSRMLNFHSKLASLEFRECNTCSERFPNLMMSRNSTECSRCHQDRRIPKLYSTVNNLNPGPVPQQLLVSSCVLSQLGYHCNLYCNTRGVTSMRQRRQLPPLTLTLS